MSRIVAVAAAIAAIALAPAARADCGAEQRACANTCGQTPGFRIGGPLAGDANLRCRTDCAARLRACVSREGAQRPPSDAERRKAEKLGRAMQQTSPPTDAPR